MVERNAMLKNSPPQTNRAIAVFSLTFALVLFLYSPASAGESSRTDIKISFYLAWERLQYREQEPDSNLEARAALNNMVIGTEAIKRWEHLFVAARVTLPVAKESGREESTLSGRDHQQNTLEMGWIRIDGLIGYPSTDWFNPYIGMRWSEVRQERGNFIVNDAPSLLQSVEKVRSVHILFGICGTGKISPRWMWDYRAGLLIPLSVKVTNTALPGLEFSERTGYGIEIKGGVDHSLTDSLSLGLFLYGGWTHWDGSQWKSFEWGRAKWPENDTYHMGAGLSIYYKF